METSKEAKIINDVTNILDKLPDNSYGSNYLHQILGNNYVALFEELFESFKSLNLDKSLQSIALDSEISQKKSALNKLKKENIQFEKIVNLSKEISRKKSELTRLRQNHIQLTNIIGSDKEEGTIINTICKNLDVQIKDLVNQRDKLEEKVSKLELEANEKGTILLNDFNKKAEDLENSIEKKKQEEKERVLTREKNHEQTLMSYRKLETDAELEAKNRVKLIKQFSDFLEETNKNMNVYFWSIIGVFLVCIIVVLLSIPTLLDVFESYNTFINGKGRDTTWHIINYSLGILIIKLPWAICVTAIFTGIYSLLKGLLVTYEKINQDKRNMSAIYAISGNVAESLNEYGMELINSEDIECPNKEQLQHARERAKWNGITDYFSKMQEKGQVIDKKEDSDTLKFAKETLNKLIERVPRTKVI